MRTEAVDRFWAEFCSANPDVDPASPFQVWYFGNGSEMAAELADLVLTGKKTATASSAAMNELRPDDAPVPNGYSVVTDFEGAPLCVIRTEEIRHIPFEEVDGDFAAEEGEGDLSLECWRRVHWDYFTKE